MENLVKKLNNFVSRKYCMVTLAVCIVSSTLITLAEVIIKMFNFDTPSNIDYILENARLMLIYLAANALVGLLIELRSRMKTIEKETPKSFINLIEAADSIKDVVKNAAYKKRTDDLIIKIYGRRHRQNMGIIKSALDDIRGSMLPHRKIIICLYYSNPDFLESLKTFNGNSSFIKMINDQKNLTENSMKASMNEIDTERYNFVKLKIKKHFDTPPFWAIQIDNNDIFWGYFMRTVNDDSEYFQGTPNQCFHFDNGALELDGFSDWINNIFERLDKWSQEVE